MKLKALYIVPLIASAVGVLAGAEVSFAGTCTAPHGCVASGSFGSADVRDFATNDGNLTDNYYDSGVVVNDHVASIRIPSASVGYMCVYLDVGWNGGEIGWTSYVSSWKNVNADNKFTQTG